MTTQRRACSPAPSAVECGKPGVPANEPAAARFLDACLHLAEFPAHPMPLDERVVRQDGLCYLMERVPFAQVRAADAA